MCVVLVVIEHNRYSMSENYSRELLFAQATAQEAGKILMESYGQATMYGKSAHDIGTKPEVIAEERIKELIQRQYPKHNFWGEETGEQYRGGLFTWIIDPLDGTRNYLHGIPYFSVSIALQSGDEVVMGVVYNPYTGDLVHAQKGQGAFWGNRQLIMPNDKSELAEAVICSDWGGSEKHDETIHKGIRNLERLITASRSVVVHFSPALDLCRIAIGMMDVLVTLSTEVEDHAAGALIVKEAGGVVSNVGSETWDFRTRGIVAANASLHTAVQALLA